MEAVQNLNSKNRELFSWKQFTIISSVHLLAIYGSTMYFSWAAVGLLACSHVYFTTIGGSIGLHRYFSHKSFEIKNKTLDFIVHLSATLCLQGGPIYWATTHRAHHKFSENYGDPHSATRGFFWSHLGWLFYKNPNGFSYLQSIKFSRDLKKIGMTDWFEKNHLQLNIGFLAILFAVSTALNDLSIFFWLGPIRIVSVWHATWLVNSYAHSAPVFGVGHTKIKNSFFVCITSGGDGEHAYHHEKQFTARHSRNKFHLDYAFGILKVFSYFNLIKFKKISVHNDKDIHDNVA